MSGMLNMLLGAGEPIPIGGQVLFTMNATSNQAGALITFGGTDTSTTPYFIDTVNGQSFASTGAAFQYRFGWTPNATITSNMVLELYYDDFFEATVNATAMVANTLYRVASVGTTDFTLYGATSNAVGEIFLATGAGTGSGTVTVGNFKSYGNPAIGDTAVTHNPNTSNRYTPGLGTAYASWQDTTNNNLDNEAMWAFSRSSSQLLVKVVGWRRNGGGARGILVKRAA